MEISRNWPHVSTWKNRQGDSIETNLSEDNSPIVVLKAAGCERIYREKVSGGRWDRPVRSLRDVLMIMERLGEA